MLQEEGEATLTCSAGAEARASGAPAEPLGQQQSVHAPHARELATELAGIHLEELMADVRQRALRAGAMCTRRR